MNRNQLTVLLSLAAGAGVAHAQTTVAYWNFNTLSGSTPDVIASDSGSGTLYMDGQFGSSDWGSGQLSNFGGSTLNAFAGDVAGQALALVGSSANGFSIVFAVSMAGLEDLSVSYATRGTSTGFTSQSWAWSTDAVNFESVGASFENTNATSFSVRTLPSIPGLNNAATAYLRLTLNGATGTSGNNRLDNIQFNANTIAVVPLPPAAWAGLAMLGGIVAARRLRR